MDLQKPEVEYSFKHHPLIYQLRNNQTVYRNRIFTMFCIGFVIGITLGQLVH